MKELAVIMSVYKNDNLSFLTLAVESILQQTYTDFDFYIQGDGILDDKVRDYLIGLADKRVIFKERTQNKGLAFSLNELLSEVINKKYSYIARMDADDISLPLRFEKQLDYLKENLKVDVLGTWAIEIDEKGNDFFRKKMPVSHKECENFFVKRDCLIHPTVMYRYTYFEKAGFYPTNTFFAEDTKMWLEGFINGCVFNNLPDYLFKFRLDSNFFERRRGWEHSKNIFLLRVEISKRMNYGFKGFFYAFLYATIKMMPKPLLSLIYMIIRNPS